jgi:hypothetical protein
MVAASTGVGPGPARGTRLRQAAALPATGRRPQSLGRLSGQDRASEGQDDGVVVRVGATEGRAAVGTVTATEGRLPTRRRRVAAAMTPAVKAASAVAAWLMRMPGSSAVRESFGTS